MAPQDINRLAKKWRDGTISEKERIQLEQWYQSFDDSFLEIDSDEGRSNLQQRLYQHITEKASLPKKPNHRKPIWIRYAAAALVIISVAFGLYLWQQQTTPIQPGGNRATLTLADGRSVQLSTSQSGIIIGEDITYHDGSTILPSQKTSDQHIPYATLTTPKGGTYQITLSDGTNVWLNANSTLRYPLRFSEKERAVELTGEAYFSVTTLPTATKDKTITPAQSPNGHNQQHRPFLVHTAKQVVEVWGTQFNISAYADEPKIRTTLAEGSVRIALPPSVDKSLWLKPGEQAILVGDQLSKRVVNVKPYTAWRSGYFTFDKEHITSIMRKLSRWYDIEVEYEGPVPNEAFGGTINRFEDLREVLNLLESTGKVHFTITGRRVKVMK